MTTRVFLGLFFIFTGLPFHSLAAGGAPLSKPMKPASTLQTTASPLLKKKIPAIKLDKLDPKSLKKGGGWGSSGGGSGVACFTNPTTAEQAQVYIAQGLPLPLDLKKQIQQLETLDYWEWKQAKPFALFQPKSQDFQEIVQEMYKHASLAAPIFIYRLQQTSQVIELTNWSGKTSLPRIDDATPTHNLPESCKLIQLAARYTNETYVKGEGPSVRRPLVKVDFDQDLFAMLDPLNQAILVVHEQMYLLGQATGHDTSNEIRPLVLRLFQEKLDHQSLRWDLVWFFGDYILYFAEDFKVEAAPGTQESRFNSFYEMLRRTRAQTRSCVERKKLQLSSQLPAEKNINKFCKDEAMDPRENQKWFTDEMAFLFVSYYYLDGTQKFFNAELLLAPLKDFQFLNHSQANLEATCKAMGMMAKNRGPILNELAVQGVRYCQSIQL